MPVPQVDIQVGDVVQTRKSHPCGGDRWQVYRIGADIGIRCLTCGHRVMLPRRQFDKSVKSLIAHHTDTVGNEHS